MGARTLDTDPTGLLPCMSDPGAFDINYAESPSELPLVRQRVIAAMATCSACPEVEWCAVQALRNPPEHACVQGGLIWPGLSSHRGREARERAARPVPYHEWRPTIVPAYGDEPSTEPDRRCGTPAGANAHRRRSEQICEPCRNARNEAKEERRRRAITPTWRINPHNVQMATAGYPPVKLTKAEQRAVAEQLMDRTMSKAQMAKRMRCTVRTVTVILAELRSKPARQQAEDPAGWDVDTVAVRHVVDGKMPFADLNNTPEQVAVVAAMLAQGHSRSAIAEHCHIGPPKVNTLAGLAVEPEKVAA